MFEKSPTEIAFEEYLRWLEDGRRAINLFKAAGLEIPPKLRTVFFPPIKRS